MCHDIELSWHNEDLAENPQNGEVDEWDSSPHHKGCKCLCRTPIIRKCALTINNLNYVCSSHHDNSSHNDLLFYTQLCVGFCTLMQLGKLTFPDGVALQDPCLGFLR